MSRFVLVRRCAAVMLALGASATTSVAQTVTVSGTGRTISITRPEGYIGIVYSGDQRVEATQHRQNDQVVVQRILVSYADYPVIVSVEPGSPAARAGLAAGDTVLSYNGKDVVKEPFPLFELLKPGTRISMRVRRNGRVRAVPVTVAPRPAAFAAGEAPAPFEYVFTPEVAEQVRREVARSQEHVRKELEKNRALTTKQREESARAARTSAAAGARAGVAPIALTMSASAVAGAEMTPMNDHLADLVGLRRGVFVVKVNSGTPADRSGLRGGDVIIAVGDSTVNDVAQVRRAITAEQRRIRSQRAAREIPLQIVRKHKKQKLVLNF